MATVNYGLNAISTVASGGVAHIIDTSAAYSAGIILSVREFTTEFAKFTHDQKFEAPVGTEALPGISFYGDGDTGLYRIGANNAGFSIAGTKLLDLSAAILDITGALKVTSTTLARFTLTSVGASSISDIRFLNSTGTVPFDWMIKGLGDNGRLSFLDNSNGNDAFALTKSTTATHVRMMVWDVDNATLEQVTVGIADSGGLGFKCLRIAN